MIYINHCTAFTHTRARHDILKTQSSLAEHRTFAILIFKTKRRLLFSFFFLTKHLYSITNSPCVFTSVQVCAWTPVSSAIVFNFQQSFDEKEKETWREREEEKRNSERLKSPRQAELQASKLSNSVHLRKIPLLHSYLNSSVHFAQFSVEPDNIPNMTRVWINSSPRYVAERQRQFRRMVFFL